MTEEDLRVKSVDTALEWTKQIITLSAGILVVSGTFIKDLFGGKIHSTDYLITSWISLCACILFGVLFMGSLCSILAKKKPSEVALYSNPAQALGILHFLSFLVAVGAFAVFSLYNLTADNGPQTAQPINGVSSSAVISASSVTQCPIRDHNYSPEFVIAILALVFTAIQLWLFRRHNRLSVKPLLVASNNKTRKAGELVLSVCLHNHGFGPARVTRFELFLDKAIFSAASGENPIEALIQKCLGCSWQYHMEKSSVPGKGYVLKAGQDYCVVEVSIKGIKDGDEQKIQTIFQRTDLLIVYESIYGEEGTYDTR